jgi:hypothetical protein
MVVSLRGARRRPARLRSRLRGEDRRTADAETEGVRRDRGSSRAGYTKGGIPRHRMPPPLAGSELAGPMSGATRRCIARGRPSRIEQWTACRRPINSHKNTAIVRSICRHNVHEIVYNLKARNSSRNPILGGVLRVGVWAFCGIGSQIDKRGLSFLIPRSRNQNRAVKTCRRSPPFARRFQS